MRLAFGTIRGLPDPEGHVRRQGAGSLAVPGRARMCVGRRGGWGRRGVGLRCALGFVRFLRPTDRPPGPLGPGHRKPVAPACARSVRTLGCPPGRALHVCGELQASRSVPEARFLARSPHRRSGKDHRSAEAMSVHGLLREMEVDGRALEEIRGSPTDLPGTRPWPRDRLGEHAADRRHGSDASRGDVGRHGSVSLRRRKRGGQRHLLRQVRSGPAG